MVCKASNGHTHEKDCQYREHQSMRTACKNQFLGGPQNRYKIQTSLVLSTSWMDLVRECLTFEYCGPYQTTADSCVVISVAASMEVAWEPSTFTNLQYLAYKEHCNLILKKISQLILECMPKADYSSLFNDFVESEFFLIDGDSLLVTCVGEESLKPGQSLHFFYLVEHYLLDVISKGGQFAIVFFKDAEYAYFSVPELLTLRTALILHLQKNTNIDVWTKFSGCLSEEWNIILGQSCPYFLIIADEGLNNEQTHLFNFVVIQSWAAKVNIVLFSGQTSNILRLYAYFMQSSHKKQMFFKQLKREIMIAYETLIRQLETYRDLDLTTLFGDLKFNNMVEKKKWCEYFILSNVHMFESENVNLLHLCDLSDEPLLKNIAFYYENENAEGLDLDIGDVIMKEYVHLWDTVSKLVRNFDVGKPFPLRTTECHFLKKTPSPIKESSQEKMPILGFIPMSCNLVDEFTGDILKDLPFLKCDDPIVTSLVKNKAFDELVHWHSHRPLSDDYDRTKANFDENSRDPRQLRSLQKYQVFQRFYGNSLESVSSKMITTQGAKAKKDGNKSRGSKAHRELLDVVDNYESAVIVAPTSSGKTYASYYCMEKVLKESDEGVVVYVAPTKALVNQVAATVQNRYTKILPAGGSLCGVFTREYRHDALNCQVLITVPACFEILLLAPHRQNWVKKIRYVIFDEVHCLGGEIGAEIWEHLLVMIRCPFLALSATISNPQHLTEWLQSVKRYWKQVDSEMGKRTVSKRNAGSRGSHHQDQARARQSYKVRLVLYGERYNDLEKYLCSVRQDDVSFDHFHPCAALTTDHIEKYGFPSDLAFSPRESIQLYDTMLQVWERWPQAQNLCPENFTHFKDKIVIKKLDARKYEESLKEEFRNWITNGNEEQARMVLQKLSPDFQDYSGQMLYFFPLLVEKLKEMEKLPALFFLFRLGAVEGCAEAACQFLEDKQEEKRPPKADKEAHDMANKLRKVKKSLEKQKTIDEKSQKPSRRLDQSIIHEAEHSYLLKSLEKNLAIPQDCTYADQKAIDDESLQMVFGRVKFERKGTILKNLARRGIGFHHSSMSAKEKQLVEILFRKGFIRVVTATGTLALGINMPCKSVVFAQNSIYLDALNFRQMSGRAGRRGQDLLGDVYFFDIPLPKIRKLIKSKVPELRGQFPLSITLILRLMLLASKADDPEDGKAKALSVLKHSLLSFKHPRVTDMLKLYVLYSLQFLVKEGYIDQEGNPTGFAGLVSHLHYHEPSNLVFVSFLVRGLFHNLCQPTYK
ncbi:hypothetical protein STEG23_024020, partial [Scotinomys teguina]